MIEVRVLNAEPIKDIKEATFVTMGKRIKRLAVMDNEKEFDFWFERFMQKHSIVRSIHIRVTIDDCRPDVARQLLRATKNHPQPYMQAGRPDWTGKPRSDDPIMFSMDFTPDAWMALANQRLCLRAMKETRDTVKKILVEMADSGSLLLEALAMCSVPNCIFQHGCPEGKMNCGWFSKTIYPYVIDLEDRYINYFEWLHDLGEK